MVTVRFKVLKASSVKMRVFWDIVPCSLGVRRRFRGAYCHQHYHRDDAGITHLWSVSLLQRDYTALYPRTLSSSTLSLHKTDLTRIQCHEHLQNNPTRYRRLIPYCVTPNVVAKWLKILLRIREVPSSNVDKETSYRDAGFSWFPSDPPSKCWDTALN
jgi:hypothetical protein